MKLSRFSTPQFYLGVVILMTSCGSGGNEKTTATDSTTSADTAAKVQAVNTIVTTPQNMEVITHKVADFAKWSIAYEGHDSGRLASGLHNYVIGRGLEDSNIVLVALKVDDTSKAKAFAKDPGLKAAMKKSGSSWSPNDFHSYRNLAGYRKNRINTSFQGLVYGQRLGRLVKGI